MGRVTTNTVIFVALCALIFTAVLVLFFAVGIARMISEDSFRRNAFWILGQAQGLWQGLRL